MSRDSVEPWVRALSHAHPHGAEQPIGGRCTTPGRPSRAEAGGWLSGCGPDAMAVTLWMLLFDDSLEESWFAIIREAERLCEVHRRDFSGVQSASDLRRLCGLILDEIRKAPSRRTKSHRAQWMSCSLKVWNQRYERAHRRITHAVEKWLSAGEAAVKRNNRLPAAKNSGL